MANWRTICVAAGIILALTGCASVGTPSGEANLDGPADAAPSDAINKIAAEGQKQWAGRVHEDAQQLARDEEIHQAGLTYGAQDAWRTRWIYLKSDLIRRNDALNAIFPFAVFYLDEGHLQPPVLDAGNDVLQVEKGGNVRDLVNHVYRVTVQARFTTTVLTWRDFLLPATLQQPQAPQNFLLPATEHEAEIWKHSIEEGWPKGIMQANAEFQARLAALNNAWQGMALYTLLAMQGMVEPPRIKMQSESISKSENKLFIGHTTEIIAQDTYFVAEPNHWKPLVFTQQLPTAILGAQSGGQ